MSSYVQLDPVFRVKDWDALHPLVQEGYDKVRISDPNTHAYLFTQDDQHKEILSVHEVYPDGEAVVQHLQNVGGILAQALDGPCVVERIYASGPAQELKVVQPHLDPLGSVTYFETFDDAEPGISHVTSIANKDPAAESATTVESFVILPIFTVHDWDKVKSDFIKPLNEVAAKEPGCVYYSFARNTNENLLLVRERYVTAEAARQHLQGAGPILAQCISEGILELKEASVYGTPSDIDESRSVFDPFGMQYRGILHAFDRIRV